MLIFWTRASDPLAAAAVPLPLATASPLEKTWYFSTGAAKTLEIAARTAPGTAKTLEIAARTAPGTAKTLEITARTALGTAKTLEITFRPAPGTAKTLENPCSNPTGTAEQPLLCDLARRNNRKALLGPTKLRIALTSHQHSLRACICTGSC